MTRRGGPLEMTKKILIAEDDRSLASSIGRALEGDGYACHFATDGVDAIRKARSFEPDLIILDLLLPKKDGRSVLRELRDKSQTVPVLAISGVFRGHSAAEELRELGANEFLDKPFTVRMLLEKTLELVGSAEEPEGQDAKIRLTEQTPAEILWRLMSSGFSGAVQFQRDKLHKAIVLEDGRLRLIRSNSARESLGRRLLAAGRIDRAALDESLRRCRDNGKRQGEVFVDLGLMTAEEVDAELEAQATEKLLSVFSWEYGEAWEQEGVTSLSHASPVDHWAPRALILFGAKRMTTAQVARYLNPLGDAPLSRVEIGLDAEELRAPGVTEFFKALGSGATLPDHLNQHGRAIYGLWLVGALAIGDASDEAGAGDPKVSELQQLCAQLQGQSFFEILGVTAQADASEIRRAFLRKAKSYHPDRFSSESEAVRRVAGEVFSLMSSAHDTLTDKDARSEYLARLARGSETGRDHAEIVTILRAESLFRDAEAHLKRRDYAGAASLLREAVELNPKEGEFQALMGWCHFLEHREQQDAVAQAITALEQAIQLSPSSTSGYYYMAKLHKACERHAEARTMFRKVLEIDPQHQEAMREVRLASMRNQNKGGSGLFGFGRKK
jgi:CheY-like chemotaxis protein/DnaJ-domain-containing protein 1